MKQAFLPLGEIVAPHGVRGEVRVNPNTDDPELLCAPGILYYDAAGKQPFRLLQGAPHKNVYLLRIEGVNNADAAAALRGRTVYAPREAFDLEEGEHFIVDLMGMSVVDADTKKVYGKLSDVRLGSGQRLFVIKNEEGETLFLPWVPPFVSHVDDEEEIIYVTPPEGLFDA